jgi:hypothetical protein
VGKYPRRRCKANRTGGTAQCGQWAMHGQLVCFHHGGNSPQAKAKAFVRVEEERAMTELARLNVTPVANALEELQRHAGIVLAFRDRVAIAVNKLTDDTLRYEGKLHGEQLRGELGLWERALDRCTVTLTGLARAQVDERLARISQQKADMMAEALSLALADAGLAPEVAADVRKGFARRLRLA